MHYLNKQNRDLIQIAKDNSKKYKSGDPFPHICFDNFFNPDFLDTVLNEFPDLAKKRAKAFESEMESKLSGKGERFFGDETKKFMHFLNSEYFLNFLQELTGIEETLIGDPYFIGGGQHEIKRGGFLKIHADFNKHKMLSLDRRINVLVYLNKDWKEEYGGFFELWDEKMESCRKRITPHFNTMAIFSTTDFSYHGHPDVLTCPEDRSRKSLALYYYSNGRPAHEVIQGQEIHSTLWKERVNVEHDKKSFSERVKPKKGVKSLFEKTFHSIKKLGKG